MTSAAAGILSVLMGPIGVVYATLLMTVLIILGEILPKAFVKDKAENFALGAAAWVYFCFLLSPLTWLTTNLSIICGAKQNSRFAQRHNDELLSVVETMGEEGGCLRSKRIL